MQRLSASLRRALVLVLGLSLVFSVAAEAFGAMYSLGNYPSGDVPVVVTRGVTVNGKKLVALTFDDGPSNNTPLVLDVLRDRGVRATFFTTGWIDTHPAEANRAIAEGHQIASHTYEHKSLTSCDVPTIRYQVLTQQALIQAAVGIQTGVFRSPFGNYDARVYNAVPEGISIHVGWDVDPQEWRGLDSATIISRVVSGAESGGIVLLHDGPGDRWQTIAALPAIIDTLRARGCEFVTIDGLCSAIVGGVPFVPAENGVYRFYNIRNGTHFYTSSADEAGTVLMRWPFEYRYEGVAYVVNPLTNAQPLLRFYNKRNGSHFYTASTAEADYVIATWPDVYTFEGEAYKVSATADGGAAPVFRFYNVRNGTHFYTADSAEADHVIATWPHIYTFEGPAFWIAQ